MEPNKEKHKWLTSLITGWGVKESWAKIIAGAIIGALCACGFLTGCAVSYESTSQKFNGTVVIPQEFSK